MDFFNSAIDVFKAVVIAIGAGMVLVGIIQYLSAQSSNDAGGKHTGANMIMAGGGITLVGIMLVPKLTSLFAVIEISSPEVKNIITNFLL